MRSKIWAILDIANHRNIEECDCERCSIPAMLYKYCENEGLFEKSSRKERMKIIGSVPYAERTGRRLVNTERKLPPNDAEKLRRARVANAHREAFKEKKVITCKNPTCTSERVIYSTVRGDFCSNVCEIAMRNYKPKVCKDCFKTIMAGLQECNCKEEK